MTLKEYIKVVTYVIIPILIGIVIGASIIGYFIRPCIGLLITDTIFAIIYCYPAIKYMEKMFDKISN